jgi:hypothetical protein
MKRYTVELSDRKRSRHVDAQFPSDAVVHVVGNRLHSKREAVRYPDGFTIFECLLWDGKNIRAYVRPE